VDIKKRWSTDNDLDFFGCRSDSIGSHKFECEEVLTIWKHEARPYRVAYLWVVNEALVIAIEIQGFGVDNGVCDGNRFTFIDLDFVGEEFSGIGRGYGNKLREPGRIREYVQLSHFAGEKKWQKQND